MINLFLFNHCASPTRTDGFTLITLLLDTVVKVRSCLLTVTTLAGGAGNHESSSISITALSVVQEIIQSSLLAIRMVDIGVEVDAASAITFLVNTAILLTATGEVELIVNSSLTFTDKLEEAIGEEADIVITTGVPASTLMFEVGVAVEAASVTTSFDVTVTELVALAVVATT